MGMYDNLRCDFPLPNEEAQHQRFQTKDFRCDLEQLVITSAGRLVRVLSRMPDEKETSEDLNYDGDVFFYTYLDDDTAKPWYEYEATFKNGQVQTIRRVDDSMRA